MAETACAGRDAAGEFHPLIRLVRDTQGLRVIDMRCEAASSSVRASVVNTTANILDSVVISSDLAVDLRDTALPTVIQSDLKTAGAVAVWRITKPDGLFPSAAFS